MIKCLNAIRINPYCKPIDVLPYNANCTYVHASWSNYKKLKLINFLFDDDSKPTRYETSDDMKPEILKIGF